MTRIEETGAAADTCFGLTLRGMQDEAHALFQNEWRKQGCV